MINLVVAILIILLYIGLCIYVALFRNPLLDAQEERK